VHASAKIFAKLDIGSRRELDAALKRCGYRGTSVADY
jgi:hypothetical protein